MPQVLLEPAAMATIPDNVVRVGGVSVCAAAIRNLLPQRSISNNPAAAKTIVRLHRKMMRIFPPIGEECPPRNKSANGENYATLRFE
jgi:hypothetical protein